MELPQDGVQWWTFA